MDTLIAHAQPDVGDLHAPDIETVQWLESLTTYEHWQRWSPTFTGGLYQIKEIEYDTGEPLNWDPAEHTLEIEFLTADGERGTEHISTTFELPPGIR